jgi:MFS family permease
MDKFKAIPETLRRRLMAAAFVILCGLTLRLTGYDIGLPYLLVKYGGSLLWGMMVFWIVGAILYGRSVPVIALAAAVIAVLTEFSRLYHTPWLDAFRLTLAGALLLGRIFAWANILAYLLGILIAAFIEWRRTSARQ